MRFVCTKCGELVSEEEVIVEFADALAVTHINAFHEECWQKEKEQMNRIAKMNKDHEDMRDL